MYDYLRRNARLLGNCRPRPAGMPDEAYAGTQVFIDLREGWFRALADAFEVDDAPHPALGVAIRHALDFQTCHSLTSRGLSDAEARDAMTSFVTLMAGRPTVR